MYIKCSLVVCLYNSVYLCMSMYTGMIIIITIQIHAQAHNILVVGILMDV